MGDKTYIGMDYINPGMKLLYSRTTGTTVAPLGPDGEMYDFYPLIEFMRKDILLPGLAVGGGAVGFILRRWQWASAYDAESQLFRSGAVSTLVLLGVLVLLSALLLVLSAGGAKPNEFLPAFFCPSPMYMAGMAASGFLFFGAGLLGLLGGAELLSLSRSVPELVPVSYPLTHLLCALLNQISDLIRRFAAHQLCSLSHCRVALYKLVHDLVGIRAALHGLNNLHRIHRHHSLSAPFVRRCAGA